MTERITQIANNGILHFVELTLALYESDIDGILSVACTAISAWRAALRSSDWDRGAALGLNLS